MKYFLLFILALPLARASEVVTILASDSIPPYVMGDEPLASSLPGLQVEIVDTVFSKLGLKTTWKMMPNHRIEIQYKLGYVDAALNLPNLSRVKNYSSADLVTYRNCVIGPPKYRFTWRKLAPNLTILGFQTAKNVFVDVFGEGVLSSNNKYNEVTSQKTIAYHALSGRADLVLSDALVFAYYAQTYFKPQYEKADLMCLYELQVARHLGFKDKRLRDRFNEGLAALRDDGTYNQLIRKYREKFSLISQLESTNSVKALPVAQK